MGKLTKAGLGALAVLAGAALFLAIRKGNARPLELGDAAPNFSLSTLDRGGISLDTFSHRVLVVNFWATWCPPCVMEAPSLEHFVEKTRPLGVAVLGVSVDQDPMALERFVSTYHLTYPIARDPNQALAGRFGTRLFPETYIFDRRGHLAEKVIGAIDWDDPRITQFVEALAHWGSYSAPPTSTGAKWETPQK